MKTKLNKVSTGCLVLLAYTLLSCVMTYPLVFNLGTKVWGGYGDGFGVIWSFWVNSKISFLYIQNNFSTFLNFPFGMELFSSITQPICEFLLFSFA